MSDESLSVLVHGSAGAGKTTFAVTGPKPLLLLDVEKAARFIRAKKVKWNPMTEAPPIADGSWEICVVPVDDWKKAEKAYEWLKSRQHPFKSVVIDSISELQSKAQEDIKGRQQFQMQDWGKLLNRISFFVRDLRDLAGDDENIVESVVVTAMSKDYDGIVKPYLQGQISAQIPYWLDITGYLYVEQVADPTTGELTEVRNLLIGNHPNYEAKSRVPGLPPVIGSPNVTEMLKQCFPDDEYVEPPELQPVFETAPQEQPVQEEVAAPNTGFSFTAT